MYKYFVVVSLPDLGGPIYKYPPRPYTTRHIVPERSNRAAWLVGRSGSRGRGPKYENDSIYMHFRRCDYILKFGSSTRRGGTNVFLGYHTHRPSLAGTLPPCHPNILGVSVMRLSSCESLSSESFFFFANTFLYQAQLR